ncbi:MULTISPECIES: SdpI family protein [Corynebacterium]|uniref:SdpI family protein n=1 Tax=Corynebacterium TaxID=1716 RepID=UPI00195AA810|nr:MULTISPECIES: SdpI family protein [Corynebacterium]MDN8624935.1 SdpI family protein [Corynebacterium kroppenstedtii]QRQ65472.1 SdpI family protein [Corynebacterium kroppenstedtii]
MPVVAALIASVGLVIVSVLCLTLPGNAASGKVPRNSAIGIRTTETKKSDEGWNVGHRAAARILKRTGIVALILTAALLFSSFFRGEMSVVAVTCGVLGYVVVIGGLCWAAVVANNAAKEINHQKQTDGV